MYCLELVKIRFGKLLLVLLHEFISDITRIFIVMYVLFVFKTQNGKYAQTDN